MHEMETRDHSCVPQEQDDKKIATIELRTGKERRIFLPITIVLLILTFLATRGFLDSSGVKEESLNTSPVTLHVYGEEVTVDGHLARDAFAQLPTITELAGVELDYDPADFSSPGPSDEFIANRQSQSE